MNCNIRPATPDDIPDLAKLLLMAAHGLVDALYQGAIPGLPTNEIVERRFHRIGTCASYENWWLACRDRQVVGWCAACLCDR